MRVAVVGAGGVGGYFGVRWAESGLDVALLARGAHLDAIRTTGLQVRSPLGDADVEVQATDDAGQIGEVDLVVLATKTWQLPAALEAVGPMVGDNTVLVGLQNGVQAAEQIATEFGQERVLGGSCRIISFIEKPGVIRHVGADPTVIVGELSASSSARAEDLAAVLDAAKGLKVHASEEIEAVIWRKFYFFAPVAGVSSVAQVPMGELRSTLATRDLLRSAMDEVIVVAQAAGVVLEDDVTERSLAFVDKLPQDGTSSMQRDFAAGRRTELEALNGTMVRLGRELGVEVPTHDFLYSALLPRELRARRRS